MNRLKRFVKYYIKGEYHCDTCPFCWEEPYYEDSDAGCYIKGEIQDTCRLIPPIRFIIGWGRRKKVRYLRNHEYDGYADFLFNREAQQVNMELTLRKYLENRGYIVLQCRRIDIPKEVTQYIVPPQCLEQTYKLMDDMCNIFTPPFESLKTRWKNLIKDTWKRFVMIFKPYFCK